MQNKINSNKQKFFKNVYILFIIVYFLDVVWCGSVAPDRGAEGEAKWQTLANWSTDRAREKAILDRLIEEEIPEVAEIAETAESFGLAEEQAERWQPIVRQWAEAYVKQKANALKGRGHGCVL